MCDQAMSAAKDNKEAKKPTSEAKRMLQNDQEKQRKEKIKTCIGEIAKELPPSADHIDRKPSTLSIVSQAKEYIKKLKEQNHVYESNLAAEQQQEELKRLREVQTEHLDKIKKLEETLKAYALEKVLKPKSSEDNAPTASTDRESPTGRRRSKTINKLLEKERTDQILAAHSDIHSLDGTLSLLGNFGHHGNSSTIGSGGSNSLPPSSLVLPVQSSGISIMTVAPTILSVKSPSLGQTRNQQTSRSISTSSVVGSGTSSRVSSSAPLVSYLDVMGSDFSDSINGLGNSSIDGAQTNLVYSTSSVSSAPSSVLVSGSGSVVTAADIANLQQMQNTSGGGSSGGIMGSMQAADLSLIHHHHHQQQQQQQGVAPIMSISHQPDGSGPATALQTLASVATSSHLSGMGGVSLASSQHMSAPGGIMGLSVGLGGGLSAVSLGQFQHSHQPPIMTLSHSDSGTALSQDRKQVLFNGQILTLMEQGQFGSHQQTDADCQNSLQASICPQPTLSVGANTGLQQGSISVGGLLGQGSFTGGHLGGGPLGSAGPSQPSIIYTINDQGQLVPLQAPMNPIQQAPSGLEFMTGPGGNFITNFQNPSSGGTSLITSSMHHQPQSSFLAQPPIMSIAGGQGSNQPFTILPPSAANPLQPQMISNNSFLVAQQFPQQQQVLNLSGFGGLQVVNPFTGMIVNNLGTTLNGATVKLVGNELKLVQPGDNSSGAQCPTHVMVDGSLIPISTNPQTIMPSPASLNTIGQKTQSIPLGSNPILQFDPNNPNAPPILINGPATTLHMGPQMLGHTPMYSPALSGGPGILPMASGGPLGSSIPFQLGSSGGLVAASTMVAGTVTTNSVSACISSPSVSTTSKGGKSLPILAPALSQTSPTIGSTVVNSCGYQTILPSGQSQQYIINGQKVVAAKLNSTSAVISKPSSHSRKRSPSTARASPIVAVDVSTHFGHHQQQHIFTASGAVMAQASSKFSSGAEKSSKSKQPKQHNNLQHLQQQQQQQQQEDEKRIGIIQKKDLLAQATATAGILMESESGNLNISAGSNMNLSGSSAELQISLKQSPRDEEDDNVQLIIDENCVSGVSSTSPAHSSFSPNMMLGAALSVSTSSSVFSHDINLGSGGPQHLHIQPHSGDLTTPLVSPNITSTSSISQLQKQPSSNSAMSIPNNQLLSPLSSNIFTTSSTSGMMNPSTNSELQIVAGPFRPEDVFAQLSGAIGSDVKVNISPEAGSKLSPLTTFSVSTSVPLSLNSTSPVPKLYIPIAPAPVKVSTISSALTFAQDAPTFTFADSMGSAAIVSEKPANKGKCRSKKATPATIQLNSIDVTICGLQQEPKKKPPPKKRKTKAELKLEKEEKERLAKEEEEKKREAEEQAKKEQEQKVKDTCFNVGDDDSLLPVLEMKENEAVKEQILHSVSESKVLNTDGSHISLMDMVDKIEMFNSEAGSDNVYCNGILASDIGNEMVKPAAEQSTNLILVKEQEKNISLEKTSKRESTRKRKNDANTNSVTKVENKRSKKPKPVDILRPMEGVLFSVNSISTNAAGGGSSSDIYDFVDDEDGNQNFLQPPPTATKLQTKKVSNSRKGKGGKSAVCDLASAPEVRPSCGMTMQGEARNGSRSNLMNIQPAEQSSDITEPSKLAVPTTTLGLTTSAACISSMSSTLSSPSASILSLPSVPKSPPLFASTPIKPSATPQSHVTAVSSTACVMDSTRSIIAANNLQSSCMSKKDGPDSALQSSLDESFAIEFPVMGFQTSPKLSETHDDHDSSMGIPADTLADLFNQHSPGKMILNSSPPMLQNGVLSPSDVDLPALRTPAPPMSHNQSEPVLMLDNRVNHELMSTASSGKQSVSHMQTPLHLDPKSPVGSLADISTSSSAVSLSLTATSSPSMPPLQVSLSMNNNQPVTSCMNSSLGLIRHLDAIGSPRASSQLESQMPTLSSSSLDALSEILPLKPITAELEAEDNVNNSCAQQQRRQTPVQTQPLSHVPLNTSELGMGMSQQNVQQPNHQDMKQKSQQQQPRQSQPHHPPQSSPHNLRPPSASTTPLPSPKLHASPGSASNAGSVHSMSPAAQQQQQQHSCQKQQQNSQMGSNSMIDRVGVPPLSHPPQQSPSLSQHFPNPDTSPRNTTFTSPPSGSNIKLKHMSPSNVQASQEQSSNFISSQKGGNFPTGSGQQPKNQYSVDKIIEHPNNTSTSISSRHQSDSFNFTNIGSNVTTTTAIASSSTMPLTSNPSASGFSFSLSSTNPHQQQSSCSANINASSNSSNSGSVSSMQSALPPGGAHASHNSSYLNPFFPPPPPMNLPSSSTSSSHHSLAMHPLGNMEIQHTTTRPSSGGPSAATYGIGPSSLMTFGNQPKLDIPPISKSPTYNTNNGSSGNNSNNGGSNNSSVNTGKSPSAGSGSSSSSNYSHSSSKQSIDSSASRYQASKSTAESIYQQQQKRPNTIQHPPSGMSHMDSMTRLSSTAHNNSFFPMGFSASSAASLSSASMPLRHLPDTRDIPSRSPYDYPPVPHHPAMGFAHPHSQLSSGYGTHPSFARDCARLESSHHQQQQQQQQAQQHQQQSPRKQTTPKKSSSSSSIGSSSNAGSSNTNSSSSNTASHRGGGASSSSGNGGSSSMNQDHGHSPAASSSRVTPSQHPTSQQQNSGSSSTNSSSHNRNSNAPKRKAASSSSSSKKKNTASQHTGFPMDAMDASMSQNMFESSFPYLNFPTLAQSMSPPAARPHQADTPFLSGMFNAQPRPISNTSAKSADMTASHFPLFPTRAQNSFFQPPGFGMNSMTGNHGNPTAGISPHSMAVPPHMSAFGLFGNDSTGAPDNISSNKFLHTNPILPTGHQTMDHSLQHGHQTAASLYHTRPHSAQSHMMAAFYPHTFDTRSHMGQPFNGSMGPPPFHTSGLPPINFSMHDSH